MVVDPKEARRDFDALLHAGPDLYADPRDMMPFVCQVLAYGQVIRYRVKSRQARRTDQMQGYLHDIRWNGEPLD